GRPKGDPRQGYAKGHLKFELDGKKLKGGWNLVRSRSGKYGGEKSWLLIKEDDDHARLGDAAMIVDDLPNSVASGRSLQEIAASADRVWHSNRSPDVTPGEAPLKTGSALLKPAGVKGAHKCPLPEMVEAQLASLVKIPPAG